MGLDGLLGFGGEMGVVGLGDWSEEGRVRFRVYRHAGWLAGVSVYVQEMSDLSGGGGRRWGQAMTRLERAAVMY